MPTVVYRCRLHSHKKSRNSKGENKTDCGFYLSFFTSVSKTMQ
ncbi:hypothetical protein CAEBREN_25410 [Caenorhabditis brenneri]|uniref:Uncharacterized protein n=1 Tax=Caenorhabditis brenneri TaxID=135651 RepID=G0N6P2_CAEBE|nr:hypothetical protein CAEBREN_25410 [Caenorhabditis brenneri]